MSQLSPYLVLTVLVLYFAVLVGIAWFTGKNSSNAGFFLANRNLPWYVVAYAMIGTSISGVTFISIPGKVGAEMGLNRGFGYMQLVLGYLVGYFVIATVLMPMYYRMNLTSIYGYLESRFGKVTYKTGTGLFLLSRTLGSATRMFLAALVLQLFVFDHFGVPFAVTAILMLALIYAYTFQGGLKTIIWTDTLMTTFFLLALVFTVFTVAKSLNLGIGEIVPTVMNGKYGQIFFFKNFASDPNHFVKQFVSGAFIALVMTGLDQDLMQKNLACKNIKEAQKNMAVFCIYLIVINFLFLILGALLYMYAAQLGLAIPKPTDHLYPLIAFNHLETAAGIFFILGLIGSTYSSSDSALTALTTSFCVDYLGFEKKRPSETDEYGYPVTDEKRAEIAKIDAQQNRTRHLVHLGFSVAFVVIILILRAFAEGDVIGLLFKIAGFTYGPLLGLYAFGMLTKRQIHDNLSLLIAVLAPVLTFIFEYYANKWYHIDIGFLTLILNGALAFAMLWTISFKTSPPNPLSGGEGGRFEKLRFSK